MANELFVALEKLTAAKLNRIVGAGAATNYTPTLTQGATVTKTVEYAGYNRRGDYVFVDFSLAITGAGTAANPVRIGLPPLAQIPFRVLGGAIAIFDASAGFWYTGVPMWQAAGIVEGKPSGVGGSLGAGVFTAALAAGDVVTGSVWYRTSS